MAGYPEPRPTRLTREMKLAAAEKIVDELIAQNHLDRSDRSDAINQVADTGSLSENGYSIAKNLDSRFYWSCDLEMAKILDDFSSLARDELQKAQAAWATRYDIKPPFDDGTRVLVKPTGETGYIDAVYAHGTAQYAIAIDGDPRTKAPTNARRIVNFESVEPISKAS